MCFRVGIWPFSLISATTPFAFVNEMIWQTHHNSSQAVIGVYVCIIIETVHDGETVDDIQ